MRSQISAQSESSISALENNSQQGNPLFFGELAAFLWRGRKPDYELHIRTGATERMCRHWLAGTHPPNARAVRAVLGEILRRLG